MLRMADKRTLVGIFAHPDDEAFGTGGTLTKYAQNGVDVHLITATLGEAGQFANPGVPNSQPISRLREQELRNACRHYGIKQLHLLGYMDGQTAIVPPAEPVFRLVKLLRAIKPQVVITFGPEGVYGHFDHLVVHRWASAAVEMCGDADKWPEAGPPHQVARLFYRALPQAQVDRMDEFSGRATVDMGGVPFPFTGYPLAEINAVIDVSQYAQTKLNGIRCHLSQLHPEMPLLQDDFDPLDNEWFWQETFKLAHANGDCDPTQKITDLFAGVS
jgi:LmbE family N-acetylglucosaminyl deacetylase